MDVVFFDIDDTLYDQAEPFGNAVRKVYGAVPGATDADLFAASRKHSTEVFASFERGERPSRAIYARRMVATFADFGIDITPEFGLRIQDVYASRTEDAMTLSDAMASCLDLCARRCRVGIISNGYPERQVDKLEQLGIYQWVSHDAVCISEAVGLSKPDPAIFHHACKALETTADRCLFIGDSFESDVVGAKAAGMPVVWLNRRKHRRTPRSCASWVVETDEQLLLLLAEIVN